MNNKNHMRHFFHPGEYLKEELEARNISQTRLATEIRIPASGVNDIVKGKRGITAENAWRLAKYFDTTPDLWLNLQKNYDKWVSLQKLEASGELDKIHTATTRVHVTV